MQETFVRAWKAIDRFEGRSSVRSWLYRIASNVCIDMHRAPQRRARPMDLGPSSTVATAVLAPQDESTFVQPIADDRVIDLDGDPADVAAARESIRLAFVAALQHLPARQRAVLILCEVLRWQATEVAELLDTSVASVNSALQRARATLAAIGPDQLDTTLDPEHEALLQRYVAAFEAYDMTALAALLRDDVVISMPPHDLWLQGIPNLIGWMAGPGHGCAGSKLIPVHVNGTAGFASYKIAGPGRWEPWAIQVIEVTDGRISGHHNFLYPELFAELGLPAVTSRADRARSATAHRWWRSVVPTLGEGPVEPGNAAYPVSFTFEPAERIARWRPLVALAARHPALHRAVRHPVRGVGLRVHRLVRHPLHGQAPGGSRGFPMLQLRYQVRVTTYAMFLQEEYPPFTFETEAPDPGDYPRMRVDISPALTDRNRLTVFFRYLLVLPQAFVLVFVGLAVAIVVWIAWFVVIFTGQVARRHAGLRDRLPAVVTRVSPATPSSSPTSTHPSRRAEGARHATRSVVRPTSSISSRRSSPHLSELDRPSEATGGELDPKQVLDEAEVAAIGPVDRPEEHVLAVAAEHHHRPRSRARFHARTTADRRRLSGRPR